MKGSNGLKTASIGSLLKPHATYKQTPTGGVNKDIDTFAATKIPIWIGSIPSAIPAGTKIGIKIIIAGSASIIIPRRKNNIFTQITNTIQLSAKVTMNCAI